MVNTTNSRLGNHLISIGVLFTMLVQGMAGIILGYLFSFFGVFIAMLFMLYTPLFYLTFGMIFGFGVGFGVYGTGKIAFSLMKKKLTGRSILLMAIIIPVITLGAYFLLGDVGEISEDIEKDFPFVILATLLSIVGFYGSILFLKLRTEWKGAENGNADITTHIQK